MANTSILAAFERMWQHTVAALGSKANTSDITNLQTQIDEKVSMTELENYVDETFLGGEW